MIKYDRFPGGKKYALTLSYDDASISDRRLVQLLNKYGIKATFNLFPGVFDRDGYITSQEAAELYKGHEIAAHTLTHPRLEEIETADRLYEVLECRKRLEKLAKYPVRGMAYPCGTYNDEVVEAIRHCGIKYCRTIEDKHDFTFPKDFLLWHPTCHHDDCAAESEKFFSLIKNNGRASIFYVWGHSYEFNTESKWAAFEEFCSNIAHKEEIWYATNIEIYDYIMAQRNLHIAADHSVVYNPSYQTVWVSHEGRTAEIKAGETVYFN